MFLTRMALDTNRASTQQAMNDPGVLGKLVSNAFDGEAEHPLWRIDTLQHRTFLMMLGSWRPTMVPIHEQIGVLGAFPSWETNYIGDDIEGLRQGQQWHFHLCAAPEPEQCVTALPLLTQTVTEKHEQWLRNTAAASGFFVPEGKSTVQRSEWISFPAPGQDGKLIVMEKVTYDGVLTITDADAMRAAVCSGIGYALDYGCGLMTLEEPDTYQYV